MDSPLFFLLSPVFPYYIYPLVDAKALAVFCDLLYCLIVQGRDYRVMTGGGDHGSGWG